MSTAWDVPADLLISKLAGYLKSNRLVTPPDWARHVKTAVHKTRIPSDPDWWYTRCASILRKLYVHGPMGVSRTRSQYGGRRRKGLEPPHRHKGSGSITRKALQQLEAAQLVVKQDKKGRALSPKGRSLLDATAKVVRREARKASGEETRQTRS